MPKPSPVARRIRAAADPSAAEPPNLYAGGHFANPPAARSQSATPASSRGASASDAPARDADGNIGFEVRGFATDPKHSGYQILTNYESTYWRAFVGVQAWSLYEVLRSFCHNGNNVCYPSINYLLEVLGIKQRRVLTGWSTAVKGKQYDYPGLIEVLQNGGLVIAEVVGEGPMLRYLFHVNLTPDLLHPDQVAQLPELLQSKHAEMLQAHFAEMAELASRRRPAKTSGAMAEPPPSAQHAQSHSQPAATRPLPAAPPPSQPLPPPLSLQDEEFSTTDIVEEGGMTNCQTGMTNCHRGSDNLSYKQHQYNNTQLTSASSTKMINNNSGGLQQELQNSESAIANEPTAETDVVVALTNLGLADSVVDRLTTRFNRQRILEKIDYLAYLELYHPNKVKNPRGWLRRAIEENYGAPDGYLTAAQRAARQEEPGDPPRIRYSSFEVREDHLDTNAPEDQDQEQAEKLYENPEDHSDEDRDRPGGATRGHERSVDPNWGDAPLFNQPAQASAAAEREYLHAARRDLIRRIHAPAPDALAFWEMVRNDVHHTMSQEYYTLIADSSVLWMDDTTVAIAIWDREHYRQLLHPNRVKAFERNMATLVRRKLTLLCEFWDEEGQVVPPGTAPPAA